MMKASEVKEWIKDIDDDADLAIDDGGLCLVVVGDKRGEGLEAYEFGDYLEIGGVPLDEED